MNNMKSFLIPFLRTFWWLQGDSKIYFSTVTEHLKLSAINLAKIQNGFYSLKFFRNFELENSILPTAWDKIKNAQNHRRINV